MIPLDLDDLIYLHDEIIKNSGGLAGVRDIQSLESALQRPHQTLFGKESYATLFHKAAALLHSIALNHGFNDGNKRTAMASASLFLYLNNHELSFTDREYEDFMIHVVTKKPSVRYIAKWLKQRCLA